MTHEFARRTNDLSPLIGLRRRGCTIQLASEDLEERLADLEEEARYRN